MPEAANPPLLLIVAEALCWLAGVALLVRHFAARRTEPFLLKRWDVPPEGAVVCATLVIAGGLLFPRVPALLPHALLGPAADGGDWWLVVQGAAFQGGMLSGALIAALLYGRKSGAPSPASGAKRPGVLLAGLATFLMALPVVGLVGFAWKLVLEWFGHSVSEQEMIDLLRGIDDPALLAWMIVLAAVVAPVTEELIFRAGLFRYLRTRIPRGLALVLPALLFAVLHGNLAALVPLCVLGAFFAVAYERTGRVAVPMIAHALFNLHTIVLVMAGLTG